MGRPRRHQVETQAKVQQAFSKDQVCGSIPGPFSCSLGAGGRGGGWQGSPMTLAASLCSRKHLRMSYLIRNSPSVILVSPSLQVRTLRPREVK